MKKCRNKKHELFVNYPRTIYGHILFFYMLYLYCEKYLKKCMFRNVDTVGENTSVKIAF